MELGLFSVSYAGLWGQQRLDLPAFIAHAAELGYSAVMLMGKRPHLSPLDVDERALDALCESLAQHGVRCRADRRLHRFFAAAGRRGAVRRNAVPLRGRIWRAWPRRSMRKIVRVFTGYEHATTPPAAAWNTVVACLRECADAGRRFRRDAGRAESSRRGRRQRRAAWSCCRTSIGRTSSWASTPGRLPCAARTLYEQCASGPRRTPRSPPTPTTFACPAFAIGRNW